MTHIINSSFQSDIAPNEMKKAKVTPTFKSGDNEVFSNYRPVSLLLAFSKVLEKLFYNRLMEYINMNTILFDGQNDFRETLSTSLAIVDVMENITKSLDQNEYTIAVLTDLRKHK